MKNILPLFILLCAATSLRAQCLYTSTCTSNQQICDLSSNSPDLWNAAHWWDGINGTNDLPETPCNLFSTAIDTCGGGSISATYLLFLDLDGDDTLETVIKSWDPPAPGTVNYNNYNNPNFDGGELRSFDERAVPADQKYQFALSTLSAGDTLTARLRWNTQAAPGVFLVPELPFGKHRIEWFFEDNTANTATCAHAFQAVDCQQPKVVCRDGISVNININASISLSLFDFLLYGEDNFTVPGMLEYSIRKSGLGTGFPQNTQGEPVQTATFSCAELGTQAVELWAKDAAGNVGFCKTYVIVQDNFGICGWGPGASAAYPTIICQNGLCKNLSADLTAGITAEDFIIKAFDDATAPHLLEFGIRKCGTGAGFPLDNQGNPIDSIQFQSSETGTQCVELWARDTEGNSDYTETYIIVQSIGGLPDQHPQVTCLNGLSVNLQSPGIVQINVQDLLVDVSDNDTPPGQIQVAISNLGSGGFVFPEDGQGNPITSISFDCSSNSTEPIAVWAKDQSGNYSHCETYVQIQDNNNACGNVPLGVAKTVCILRPCDAALVTGVDIALSSSANLVSPLLYLSQHSLNGTGCLVTDSTFAQMQVTSTYQLKPFKYGDPLNGVTALDLAKISRHILGLEPLGTYAIIAADANNSRSVTAFDLVEFRRLLQGNYQELPSSPSWRFVDASYVFPNPNNPFQSVFPDAANFPFANLGTMSNHSFAAIKVGDVDCDATPGVTAPADDRQASYLSLPDARLGPGEKVEIPVSFAEHGNWAALHLSWQYDPELIEIEVVLPGTLPGLDEGSFAMPSPGSLNLVWFAAQPCKVAAQEAIFSFRIVAKQPCRLSQALRLVQPTPETPPHIRAEAFDAQETAYNLELLFRDAAKGEALPQHLIYQPMPNPTVSGSNIPLQLTHEETVRTSVMDVSGKLLWEQQSKLGAGLQMIEVPEAVLSKTGVYFWRVKAGRVVATGKIIRL